MQCKRKGSQGKEGTNHIAHVEGVCDAGCNSTREEGGTSGRNDPSSPAPPIFLIFFGPDLCCEYKGGRHFKFVVLHTARKIRHLLDIHLYIYTYEASYLNSLSPCSTWNGTHNLGAIKPDPRLATVKVPGVREHHQDSLRHQHQGEQKSRPILNPALSPLPPSPPFLSGMIRFSHLNSTDASAAHHKPKDGEGGR